MADLDPEVKGQTDIKTDQQPAEISDGDRRVTGGNDSERTAAERVTEVKDQLDTDQQNADKKTDDQGDKNETDGEMNVNDSRDSEAVGAAAESSQQGTLYMLSHHRLLLKSTQNVLNSTNHAYRKTG